MARPSDRDLVTLGPWPAGGNNLAREDSIPAGAFRVGVNVDVYPGGKVRRRRGSTQVDATPTANLWSNGDYALCTSVDGTTLYRFIPGLDLIELYVGLRAESDIAYCEVNNDVYVSDGVIALKVSMLDDSVRPWGVEAPAGQPVLSAVDGGLAPGKYQVTITYATGDGEESGAGVAATISLPDGGGIRATLSAPLAQSHVELINVYVTRTNGTTFHWYGRYPIGALDVTISNESLGRELRTFGLDAMPAGIWAAHVGARLLVATVGGIVCWSVHGYGLTDMAHSYYAYPGEIDLLAAVPAGAQADGVFVAVSPRAGATEGGKTLFLAGNDIAQANNRLSASTGAMRGAPVYVHGDDFGIDGFPPIMLPVWISRSGYPTVGFPDGSTRALTGGKYAMDSGDRVTIAQRDIAGVNQLLVGVRSPTGSMATTSDSADSVLIRNGVVIP